MKKPNKKPQFPHFCQLWKHGYVQTLCSAMSNDGIYVVMDNCFVLVPGGSRPHQHPAMDCYIMNSNDIQCLVSQIGCGIDDTFMFGDECGDALEQILSLLKLEDKSRRNIRRQLGLAQLIPDTLAPLLVHFEEKEPGEERRKIFELTIKLLMNLTQPPSSLLPAQVLGHASYRPVVSDINQILDTAKESFLDTTIAATIISEVLEFLEEGDGERLTDEDCDTINCCLLLLRHILFITDSSDAIEGKMSTHMMLIGVLFRAKLKDMLIRLCTSKQHEHWTAATVQLISLLYKGKAGFSTGLGNSSDAWSLFSGTASSISSHSHIASCKNGTCCLSNDYASSVEVDDQTMVPYEESGSPGETLSLFGSLFACAGDSSVDQSWSCSGESGGSGGTASSSPADKQDFHAYNGLPVEFQHLELEINSKLTFWKITKELEDFTEWFIRSKAFVTIVVDIKSQLCFKNESNLPDLYYMWSISYFLHQAQQFGIDLKTVRECLTVDVIGYLVHLGVCCCEQLLLAVKLHQDTDAVLQRSHLVVTALQEIFNALVHYSDRATTEEDIKYLTQLKSCLLCMKDLRYLLLLVIRHCQPHIHNLHFMRDIVVTNHNFLLMAESVVNECEQFAEFDMLTHVSNFATLDVMSQYGRLLDNFENNSPEVNDCVFTMMHHVAGDCKRHETLLQLPILKKFMELWEKNITLSMDSHDLMQFLLQQFINMASQDPYQCAEYLCQAWPQVEKEGLTSADEESCIEEDFLGTDEERDEQFLMLCEENDRSEKGVRLTEEDKDFPDGQQTLDEVTLGSEQNEQQPGSQSCDMVPLRKCMALLRQEGNEKHLKWLQRCLLDTCLIKLGGCRQKCYPEEPLPLYHALSGKSVPIVPYTEEQENILQNCHFDFLLQYMGFHMPEDVGLIFPRIPHFWTASNLLYKAEQLGEIDYGAEKFTKEEVLTHSSEIMEEMTSSAGNMFTSSENSSERRSGSQPIGSLWYMFVKKCNINNMKQEQVMAQ